MKLKIEKIKNRYNFNYLIQNNNTYFNNLKKMISFGKLLFLGIVLVIVSSVRIDEKFITFNTSASKYVVSTSISTTFDK